MNSYPNFQTAVRVLEKAMLTEGQPVHSKYWQAQDISQNKAAEMRELNFQSFKVLVPRTVLALQDDIQPNLPWADEHFEERVGRVPVNPPPSWVRWPWANSADKHRTGTQGAFSHSYPERYWPKSVAPERGVRYAWGDLDDVVSLLAKDPLTRQAYLPIFFPEDTGAVHGERIPCSIGYQFINRAGALHCVYQLRSCDLYRHLRDDLYLTSRLLLWVIEELMEKHGVVLSPGLLITHITNLHLFVGDLYALKKRHA